jgi:hypothetical protein
MKKMLLQMTSVSLQPVPSLLHRGLCPLGTPHQKKNAPYCSTSVVVWKRIKNTKIKEILDFYTL